MFPHKKGIGIFAREFMRHFPLVPAEEEGRLNDLLLRENFIERIFVCHRFRQAFVPGWRLNTLVGFHTRHKLLIMSHSPKHYRQLGRLVAEAKQVPRAALLGQYQAELMAALKLRATPAKHENVLQHVMGFFKKQLSADEKQELISLEDLVGEIDMDPYGCFFG